MLYFDGENGGIYTDLPYHFHVIYLGTSYLRYHNENIKLKFNLTSGAMFLTCHPEILAKIKTRQLDVNNAAIRPRLIAYAATNCVPLRERVFNELVNQFGHKSGIDALGVCCGTHPELRIRSGSHAALADNSVLFTKYKYVLCMENAHGYGYLTEKILNVYASGAIPIYWGDIYSMRVFNPMTYIYVNDSNISSIFDVIARFESDHAAYSAAVMAPVFVSESALQDFLLVNYDKPTSLLTRIQHATRSMSKHLSRGGATTT